MSLRVHAFLADVPLYDAYSSVGSLGWDRTASEVTSTSRDE
jgi:hypothetical protein